MGPGGLTVGERHVATTGTDAGNDCSSSTRPCRTIQRAHDQSAFSNPPEIMFIQPGTYTESVDLTRTVDLRGVGTTSRDTIIVGSIRVGRSTTIQNLALRPSASASGPGAHGIDVTRATAGEYIFEFVDIQGFPGHGINVSGVGSGSYLNIDNAYLAQNLDGVHIEGGGKVNLVSVRAQGNRGDGIQFSAISSTSGDGIVGQRLFLLQNGEAGLQVEAMSGVSAQVQNSCVLANGSQAGVTLELISNSPIRIGSSNIEGNRSGGASIASFNVMPDMTGNFWGAASGPSGAGPGGGDSVTAGLLFNQWSGSRLNVTTSGCD